MVDNLQFVTLLVAIVAAAAAIVGAMNVILRRGARQADGALGEADDPFTTDSDVTLIDVESPPDTGHAFHRRERPYDVYELNQLLTVDHLRGMDAVERLVAGLEDAIAESRQPPPRSPRRPTSVLLHGPPGGAMTIMGHVLARKLRGRLVQILASQTLPTANGGSQPLVAIAVNEARLRLPSVLMIDELEEVAGAEVRDAVKQRAANDLMNESLRPFYGASHLVVALFTTYDDRPLPSRLTAEFEHIVAVDVPDIERALLVTALRTADDHLFRAISGPRLAERPDLTGEWRSAA